MSIHPGSLSSTIPGRLELDYVLGVLGTESRLPKSYTRIRHSTGLHYRVIGNATLIRPLPPTNATPRNSETSRIQAPRFLGSWTTMR